MSLIDPVELLLLNLEEKIDPGYVFLYFPKEFARQELKRITGQDFGDDVRKWREWLQETDYPRYGEGGWMRQQGHKQ